MGLLISPIHDRIRMEIEGGGVGAFKNAASARRLLGVPQGVELLSTFGVGRELLEGLQRMCWLRSRGKGSL